MSYVTPSVLVYQQLANAGGAANVSPDLDAVIIGPCYNIVDYDSASTSSLILSQAVDGNGTPFSITNNTINNVVYLPSQKPGQELDSSSLSLYVTNAVTQTGVAGFTAGPALTSLPISVATSVTGAVTSGNAVINGVANSNKFVVGDNVTVANVGVAGAALVANITYISGSSVTLDQSASTSAASSTITKNPFNNLNSVSATFRVEVGDTAVVTYTTAGSVVKTFSTTVSAVVSTDNVVSNVSVSDMLPSDVVAGLVAVSFRKTYNNQLLSSLEYDSSTTAVTGAVTILPLPSLVYGTVISAEVHVAYRAMRTDLSGVIQTITSTGDITGLLGIVDDRNPLALGVELAMSNTVTQILAVAVPSNDLLGYETAMQLLENSRVYTLVPLTQDTGILTAVQQHVQQLSTPQMAHWRVAAVSTAVPTTTSIGPFNQNLVNANSGNNSITQVSGKFVLTSSSSTFMSDGVVPGDIVVVTASTGGGAPVGSYQVLNVISNQQVQVSATGVGTAVSFYVSRNLTKAQQAEYVASMSRGYGSSRVFNCPNQAGVVIGGVTKYLPGYYFMCGISGLIAGLPAQSGLTNIALAGFTDVRLSNFYFTRAQMDVMASAGTLLIIQDTQGSIPYIRHELTTDMTVLQYREIQQVKNWDYLSYFFYDVIRGFIGKWNITPDSLNTLRQTLDSGAILLKGRKLPKVGAPLTEYTIASVAQDSANLDNVNVSMNIKMPTVMNYINLYLIV
jgi:hypothetical protein